MKKIYNLFFSKQNYLLSLKENTLSFVIANAKFVLQENRDDVIIAAKARFPFSAADKNQNGFDAL